MGKIWVAGKDDREVGAQEGGPPRGSTDQVVPGGSHLGIGNFSGPACLQSVRALQLMGALPCHHS